MNGMKTFAIDFDGTFTSDPDLFKAIVQLMRDRGHVVVMVTQRCAKFYTEIAQVLGDCVLPVVFASGKSKEDAAREVGYIVDVWIDDAPYSISTTLTYRGCEDET